MAVGVTPKDLILRLIGEIGAAGGTGYAVEYAGSAMRALGVEGRLTICNLSIELGAKMGFVAPDDTTYAYIAGTAVRAPRAPCGIAPSRPGAGCRATPTQSSTARWRSTSAPSPRRSPGAPAPSMSSPSTSASPTPASIADPSRRGGMEAALDYMGLTPGDADRRHQDRLGVHRLVHQQPHLRPARRRRRRARPQGGARACAPGWCRAPRR